MTAARITDRQLQLLVDRINRETGSPLVPWVDGAGQVGNYHVDHVYGGVCLVRMANTGGGVTCPLGLGSMSKRQLWDAMQAFVAGIDAGRRS